MNASSSSPARAPEGFLAGKRGAGEACGVRTKLAGLDGELPSWSPEPRAKNHATPHRLRIGSTSVRKPTPMILTLNVHFSRVSDMVTPDHLRTDPALPIRAYRDLFGNWCTRIVAPSGRTRIFTEAQIEETGTPDIVARGAGQTNVEDLPEETLVFLLGEPVLARPIACRRSPGLSSPTRRRAGDASRPSATSCTTT